MRDELRGFTLLELLVVVGIMGFLGTASIAGYNALQRGMTERSVTAVASTLLRAAQERAHVDRMPTAVFCYNRLLKEPSAGSEENGVVVGVMTAIRRSGRISFISGSMLYDEFADLDTTYEAVDDENDAQKGGSFRLFRFGGDLNKMEYSIVSDRVIVKTIAEQVTLFSGVVGGGNITNLMASAFFDIGGGTISAGSWQIGDGYALEFAETQLPAGYIFGTQVPDRAGKIEEIKTIIFKPDDDNSQKVDIYPAKPDGSGWPKAGDKRIGEASSDAKKTV